MERLLILPVALPLGSAALGMFLRGHLVLQRMLIQATCVAIGVFGVLLVLETSDGTVLAANMGGWPAPFAITIAADLFSSLMIVATGVLATVCLSFAMARDEDTRPYFAALSMVLVAGVSGSFLTADLFNLFVFFEVMLMASYVLLTLGGGREQVRGGAVYVATNLFASTLLVMGVGLIYGTAGTVNMAALASLGPPSGQVVVAGALVLVAFALKASVVPLHGWLPMAYPVASPAVAALLAGLLTKVGVYALYRSYAVVFGGTENLRTLLLVVGTVTMVVGVLGAVGRSEIRSILSFHITSQVGYMIMALGLFTTLGLAGGIFFVLHNMAVKTSLFLAAGAIETEEGTGALDRLGGIAPRRPFLATGFIVSALSIAGIPPLSGFFGKLILVRATFESGEFIVAAVAILVSFGTLMSMVKIWSGAFWGHDPIGREAARAKRGLALVAPGVVLALVAVGIGMGADPLLRLTEQAAAGLIDTSAYIAAVLRP